jgi:hypothetical protein
VAESDTNCVTTATTPNSASSTAVWFQSPTATCSHPATRSAAPLTRIPVPSGMAPAMKT